MMCNRTDKPHESVGEPSTSELSRSNHRVDVEGGDLLARRAILTVSAGVDDATTGDNENETKVRSSLSPCLTKRALAHEDSTGPAK